ncbi:unnamed protein product [Prunus armeniaca]|uniref:Major facilitator superfamily (MFS) profile domain-containing protein n=1 Tax=Prunus armeniaca TaxID=36596 RepID=A0A6J5V2A9_PRUAR|nr:unnamed protein product [Prunus armeniaca]CAB4311968.1 unnamed protein product [Prunus armeniaca]
MASFGVLWLLLQSMLSQLLLTTPNPSPSSEPSDSLPAAAVHAPQPTTTPPCPPPPTQPPKRPDQLEISDSLLAKHKSTAPIIVCRKRSSIISSKPSAAASIFENVPFNDGVSLSFIIGVEVSWRALAIIGIVPCAVIIFGLFFIPESPRWLAKTGRQRDFEVALQKLRGKDADVSQEAAEIQEYIASLEELRIREFGNLAGIDGGGGGRGELDSSELLTSGVYAFSAASGFTCPGLEMLNMHGFCVVVTGLGAAVVDKAGRKPLILASASGLVLGCVLIATSFFLKVHGLALKASPIFAVAGILGAFSLDIGRLATGYGSGAFSYVVIYYPPLSFDYFKFQHMLLTKFDAILTIIIIRWHANMKSAGGAQR